MVGDVQLALGSTPEALGNVQSVVVPSQQSPLSWDGSLAFHSFEDREASSSKWLFARPQGDVLGTVHPPISKHSSTNLKASCRKHPGKPRCTCWLTPVDSAGVDRDSLLRDPLAWSAKADSTSESNHSEFSTNHVTSPMVLRPSHGDSNSNRQVSWTCHDNTSLRPVQVCSAVSCQGNL